MPQDRTVRRRYGDKPLVLSKPETPRLSETVHAHAFPSGSLLDGKVSLEVERRLDDDDVFVDVNFVMHPIEAMELAERLVRSAKIALLHSHPDFPNQEIANS